MGKRFLLAEVIGVSESGLSRSTRAGRLSPELRGRLVRLVRVGHLPEEPPPARPPGRRARPSSSAGSVMLYFDGIEALRDFVRLGGEHPAGRIGVLAEAIRAYRAKHADPPALRVEPAPYWTRCRLPRTQAARRAELEAFDVWIGGAELRPLVLAVVLGEHLQSATATELGGRVIELPQGAVEVYGVRRRAS